MESFFMTHFICQDFSKLGFVDIATCTLAHETRDADIFKIFVRIFLK